MTAEHQTSQSLEIRRIGCRRRPDPRRRHFRSGVAVGQATFYPAPVMADNFDGEGETTVEIRAVHDGERVYFLFAWDDPTRSLKQLPLLKTPDGWKLLHRGYEAGEERAYSEDKFAVLLTKINATLAGDHTFHAGPEPLPGKPRTLSGHGLHYTDKLECLCRCLGVEGHQHKMWLALWTTIISVHRSRPRANN